MKYKLNSIAAECKRYECECKRCPFNCESLCIGCNECSSKKLLMPVINCSIVKKGDWDSFGAVKLYDSYFTCVPMGIANILEYFSITKEEYDTFDEWKNDESKILEIENRDNFSG